MKDFYVKPTIKTEAFKTVDVITTSTGSDLRPDDNEVPWEWD